MKLTNEEKRIKIPDLWQEEREKLEARVRELEETLQGVLSSATPNKRDNPFMHAAWQAARKALNPTTQKYQSNNRKSVKRP